MEKGMEQQIKNPKYSDELSLIDLLQLKLFWQQKWLILIITLFCTGISVAYLFFTKPIYEAKATITAPTVGDISILNYGLSNKELSQAENFGVGRVYQIFRDVLESESIKQLFFNKIYLPSLTEKQKKSDSRDKLFNSYLKNILIKEDIHRIPTKYNRVPAKYIIIVNSDSFVKSREWIKQYLALVEKKAVAELAQLINSHNVALAKRINLLKEVEEKKQIYRFRQLKEALVIAKGVGMQNASINISENSIHNLQILESKYNYYSKLKLSNEEMRIFRLDGAIQYSETPIKPKIKLILLLGLIMGLMLGFATASLRNALTNKKLNGYKYF